MYFDPTPALLGSGIGLLNVILLLVMYLLRNYFERVADYFTLLVAWCLIIITNGLVVLTSVRPAYGYFSLLYVVGVMFLSIATVCLRLALGDKGDKQLVVDDD